MVAEGGGEGREVAVPSHVDMAKLDARNAQKYILEDARTTKIQRHHGNSSSNCLHHNIHIAYRKSS